MSPPSTSHCPDRSFLDTTSGVYCTVLRYWSLSLKLISTDIITEIYHSLEWKHPCEYNCYTSLHPAEKCVLMRSYHDESRAATAEIRASHVIYANVLTLSTLSTHCLYSIYYIYSISTRTLHTYCHEAVSGQSRFRHSDLDGQASEKWRSKQCIGPSYSPYSHIKIDFRKYGSYMSSFIVNVRDKIMIPLRCEGAWLINFSDIWPCPWLAELCWVRQTVKGNIGHLRQIMAGVCMKTSVTMKMMQWQQPQCSRCLMFCSAQNWSRPDRGVYRGSSVWRRPQ